MTAGGHEYFENIKICHQFTRGLIEQKLALKESQKNNQETNNNVIKEKGYRGKNRLAFLDLLIEAKTEDGEKLSAQGIQEEVDGFMFAGIHKFFYFQITV